jgi:hypothetical protein
MVLLVDKSIVPKTANDVKLISGGKILENDKNIAQCRAPFGDLPSTAITMHVVVQPSSAKSKPGEHNTDIWCKSRMHSEFSCASHWEWLTYLTVQLVSLNCNGAYHCKYFASLLSV